MAAVLGISGEYHDAAAALVVDGAVVAAVQEERLSRIKNDARLPIHAARACLAHAGLAAGDLDRVVFYEDPIAKLERVLVSSLRTFPRSLRQFPRAIGAQLGTKIWVIDRIAEQLGVARGRVTSTEHHRAHAASALFTSPYPRAAILTIDGVGEATSTALWHGDGRELHALGRIEYPHSLGLLYAGLTAYLGFEVNEGEYKVMGLAAYGTPRLHDELSRIIRLHDDGTFELGLPYFAYLADAELGSAPRWSGCSGRAARRIARGTSRIDAAAVSSDGLTAVMITAIPVAGRDLRPAGGAHGADGDAERPPIATRAPAASKPGAWPGAHPGPAGAPAPAMLRYMKLKVVVHEAEEGGYWAEVPAIAGCATQGETFEELLRNLYEAIEGCLSVEVQAPADTGKDRIVEIAV